MSDSKTTFTIGRDPTADIPVADGSVSRIHAEITLLDGERIFGPGDWVKFGAVTLSVADVVAAVRRKMGPVPPPLPASPPKAGAKGKRFQTGANLIRCRCGDIKSAGQPCPSCGQ
jgi:hypothetical protein